MSPIFESGLYPVIQTDLVKALQRVETFMALIDSRAKQLEILRAEVTELSSTELLNDLERCQAILDHVECRYADKRVS